MGGSRNQGRHQEVLQVQAEGKDYLDRAERMAAANCLLVYVAFFDALRHEWPSIVRELGLSEEEGKARLTALPDQGRAPSFRDLFLGNWPHTLTGR